VKKTSYEKNIKLITAALLLGTQTLMGSLLEPRKPSNADARGESAGDPGVGLFNADARGGEPFNADAQGSYSMQILVGSDFFTPAGGATPDEREIVNALLSGDIQGFVFFSGGDQGIQQLAFPRWQDIADGDNGGP
jgi:hypothetical protein